MQACVGGESDLAKIAIIRFAFGASLAFADPVEFASHCSGDTLACQAKRSPRCLATNPHTAKRTREGKRCSGWSGRGGEEGRRGGGGRGGQVGGIRKQGRSGKGSIGLSDRERANIFSASGAQPVITASIVCKWKLKKMHLTLYKKSIVPLVARASCVFAPAVSRVSIVPPAWTRLRIEHRCAPRVFL